MKKLIVLAMVAALAAPFAATAQKTTVQSVTRSRTYKTSLKDISIWYQGEVSLGFATGDNLVSKELADGYKTSNKTDFSRPLIETVHGVRITNYGFIGLGLGMQYSYGNLFKEAPDLGNWDMLMMPIFVNMKGYYPVTEHISPYLTLSLGGTPVLTSVFSSEEGTSLFGGFYCKFGGGVSYKKWIFDLGVMHQDFKVKIMDDFRLSVDSFYFNVGYTF